MADRELPIPPHFDPMKVGEVWRIPYEERAEQARRWAKKHDIRPAAEDEFKVALLLVDVQNTFCLPEFELFVAGRSGTGAVDDNRRLCQFIYRHLGEITRIFPTLDTHQAIQIFHAITLVDEAGRHPAPYTLISAEDVERGRWQLNPAAPAALGIDEEYGWRYLLHYTRRLQQTGKYQLTIWPYHAMLGGIGHALVSAVEEAIFFHSIARVSQPSIQIKGNHPLTEHYSVLGPEVGEDQDGNPIADRNTRLIEELSKYDAILVAGQAKSHCVAWTIEDLLGDELARERGLIRRLYLLEDCTSPVVVPGVIDYTEEASAAFERFAEAGAHIVRTTEPIERWPGLFR
jgi:nicotinamidase-related amidase